MSCKGQCETSEELRILQQAPGLLQLLMEVGIHNGLLCQAVDDFLVEYIEFLLRKEHDENN